MQLNEIKFISDSIKGKHRKSNKDGFEIIESYDKEKIVFLTLDGVSSEPNAKRGVTMVINFFKKYFSSKNTKKESLPQIIISANDKICESKLSRPYTTICAVSFNIKNNKYLEIASVGDTRCYEITYSNIKKLTIDHNLQDNKNIITSWIGMNNLDEEHIYHLNKKNTNDILICTDGFYKIMENKVPEFHSAFRTKNIKNITTKIKSLIGNSNVDDATYIYIRRNDD